VSHVPERRPLRVARRRHRVAVSSSSYVPDEPPFLAASAFELSPPVLHRATLLSQVPAASSPSSAASSSQTHSFSSAGHGSSFAAPSCSQRSYFPESALARTSGSIVQDTRRASRRRQPKLSRNFTLVHS
jgi:hypothetical protein